MTKTLFKYCPMNEYTWETIRTGKFYFSDWRNLNDPMEGVFKCKKKSIDLAEIVREEKKRYRVCCLSAKKENLLMWAHYADGFKGVCIEIDVNLEKGVIQRKGEYELVLKEIEYKTYSEIENLKEEDDALDLLTRKLEFWTYEEEWRILRRFNDAYQGDDDTFLFDIGEIKAVYYFSGGLLKSNNSNSKNIPFKKLKFNKLEVDVLKKTKEAYRRNGDW